MFEETVKLSLKFSVVVERREFHNLAAEGENVNLLTFASGSCHLRWETYLHVVFI